MYKICFAGQIGLSAHKDMEVHTFFEGIQSFIDFKTLLHKICAGANFRLVMGCFNEVIYGGRRRGSGDKDSISEPSAAYWPLLQLTYSYSCSH